jgi:tetratricopeptide (TPR) repeat protein
VSAKRSTGSLQEQRDFLLDSLEDLKRDRAAGEISEADYLELKDDYTVRAAAVLRAMEVGAAAEAAPAKTAAAAAPAPRRPGRRSQPARPRRRSQPARPRPAAAVRVDPAGRRRRSLLISAGVALTIVAVAGGSVALFSGERKAGAPVTGSVPSSPADRLSRAIQLDSQGKALEAVKMYDSVLADDPGNVRALAYKGWLLKRAGLVDDAQLALDKALALEPTFADAHFFRGMLLMQDRNDPAGAVVEFRAFLDNNPPAEMVPAVQEVLKRAEADAAARAPNP